MEAGVEALGGEDDPAVGVAKGDGDRVATAHQDAFDQRLTAVVVARHGGKSTGWRRVRPGQPAAATVVDRRVDPAPGRLDVALLDLDPDEATAKFHRRDAGRPDAHERVEDEIARGWTPARRVGEAHGAASGSGGRGPSPARCRCRSGASMKLCMSRWRVKFQVWPLSQQQTISSQLFRKPTRRSFGGGFVLCQTMNWNVSKAGSKTSCQRPSML